MRERARGAAGRANLKRLSLFAKGNLDVRDSLHSLRLGGELRWNGINSLLREQGGNCTIRVRHETAIGSLPLARAAGTVPELFTDRALPLGHYPLATQFSDALFQTPADAYVLSIQADVQIGLVRHRRDGFLFHPPELASWPADERQWLQAEFEPCGLPDPATALSDLAAVVERLRATTAAPILIYNLSSIVPGETVHCHAGMEDIVSTRIKRFNLGLVELSQRSGVSIIDVDRIVAEHGQHALKLDTTHLTEAGCRAVAGEVLRVLDDYGLLQ